MEQLPSEPVQCERPPNGPRIGHEARNDAVATAVVLVVVLVAGAVGLGLAAAGVAGGAARPTTPTPLVTPLVFPTPTPPRDDEAVFRQPLTAGCATADAVWVVSDGGGIGRFDGRHWAMVDTTLRSLTSVACTPDRMIAVGGAGRVLTASDSERTIHTDTIGLEDLNGIALLPDGPVVVGSAGSVLRQGGAGWVPYARGIEEDLHAIVAFGGASAWAVGADGATYRLEAAGWRPMAAPSRATLRALAGVSAGDIVAVGEGGVALAWSGEWRAVAAGTARTLRAAVRAGPLTWAGGDEGTVLRIAHPDLAVTPLDLGTRCGIRGLFTRGEEVWIVGNDGGRAGVWRVTGDRVQRWGTC